MNEKKLRQLWKEEENIEKIGWDFSHIKDRSSNQSLPWDYNQIVLEKLKSDMKLLDMGTGGGEYLLTLNHPYELTSVTESYLPNYEYCIDKLGKKGLNVNYITKDSNLPFANCSFDFVINRHESFDSKEVYRILKPNSFFITQQVGGYNNYEFSKDLLGTDRTIYNLLKDELKKARDNGFKIIEAKEFYPSIKFYDVGALVYFAKLIEWEFPDFSVDKCFNKLLDIHKIIQDEGFIESQEHRYLLICYKE